MGFTRSTGSVSHSSKSENSLSDKIIARIGTLSSFKTSSALFNFLFAGASAWRFWFCGFLEILLQS